MCCQYYYYFFRMENNSYIVEAILFLSRSRLSAILNLSLIASAIRFSTLLRIGSKSIEPSACVRASSFFCGTSFPLEFMPILPVVISAL